MTNFSSPELRGTQDLGDQFTFYEDSRALDSILNNEGVTHAQVQAAAPAVGLTPARRLPASLKKASDKLEFFESKGGGIFFRRKVLADSAQKPRTQTSTSVKKRGLGSGLGRGENDWLPRRMPLASRRAGFGATPGNTPAGVGRRTPLAPRSHNRMLPPRNPVTEAKASVLAPPVYRQSFSERKNPSSSRPNQPVISVQENPARKSLYNKFGFKKKPPASKKLSAVGEEQKEFLQPSLTKLTRESIRYLPRESLAWITQLPRESATFAELQKMMTESDKNLMDDDDTDSFEALETRLKTPHKKKPSPLAEENKENIMNESGIEPIKETEEDREEAGEVPSTPLVKSVSTSDISSSHVADIPLARSESLNNISGVEAMSDLVSSEVVTDILQSLDEYEEQLEVYRTEQTKLAEMEADLMRRIRERKAEFKTVWGVSPININTRRTVIAKRNKETPEKVEELNTSDEAEKRVRFNSGGNVVRSVTPSIETPVTSQTNQRRKSRKSFDSLKCSLNFLKTPQPLARAEAQRPTEAAPTPQALRLLSERVMEEFNCLYSDSSDTTTIALDLQSKVRLDFSQDQE